MSLITYRVPTGSAFAPFDRVGPPAFVGAEFVVNQGTNRDFATWKFDQDVNESIMFEVPVSDSYVGGARFLRLRWRSSVSGGSVKWSIQHEPTGPGEQFDETYSGLNTGTTSVPATLLETVDTLIPLNGNVWVAGNTVHFHLFRDATDPSDNHLNDAELLGIDILQDVPGGGGGGGLLNGFNQEVFSAASFSFASPISTISISGTPDSNVLLIPMRSLDRNGVGQPDRVVGTPTSPGEWRINAGTGQLEVFGDVTASGDEYTLRYPTA